MYYPYYRSNGSPGGLVIDVLVIFKRSLSNQIIPGVNDLNSAFKDAARYRYFGSLVVCMPDFGVCEACAATIKGKHGCLRRKMNVEFQHT